jgi:flagella basal body P-ring formation protein FlgA
MMSVAQFSEKVCRRFFFCLPHFTLFVVSSLCLGAEGPESVEIKLKENVLVTEARVLLSQLIDCEGDERQCAEVMGLQFDKEILPNQFVDIDRMDILQFVRSVIREGSVHFSGDAKRVRVKSTGHRVSTVFVKEAIRQSILEKLGENKSLRFIDLTLSGFTPKFFFSDELDFEVDNQVLEKPSLDAEDILAFKEIKNTTLKIRRSGGDRSLLDSQKIYLKLSFETERAVVTRYMMPGETIQHADVSTSWVPLTKSSISAVVDKATLVGRVCSKGLSPYRAISSSSLNSDKIVSKGDKLTLQSEVGGLVVEKNIVAKQSGSKGDTIVDFDV